MPTNSANSADPQQLAGFADLVRPRNEAVRASLTRLAWALATYRSSCAEFPIQESVCSAAGAATDALQDLLAGTERVAIAFAHADVGPGPGPTGVHWADDVELAVLLDEVVAGAGGIDGDVGIITDHDTSWSLTAEGLDAGITASLLLGARITKEGTLDLGPMSSTTRVTGTVGAMAEADASITIGKDGVHATVEGEAFAGAKAEIENETSFGPCRVTTTGTASAGIGVSGSLDAEISRERVSAKVAFLTTLGIGGGADVAASCDVPDPEDLLRWANDAQEWVDDGTLWIEQRADDVGGWIDDRLDDLPWVSR
ncbi:MAG: hypothetical protein KF906_07570 [Actinobacteria bacterium]|nr:hypothetical protein [Actinomycetota bacterium]